MSQQQGNVDEETGLQEPLLTLHSIAEEPEGSRGGSSHGTRSDSPFAAFASQSSMSQYGSHSLDRRAMNREAAKLNPQLRYSHSLSAADMREWNSASQSRDSIGSGEARSNWRRAGNKVMKGPEMSRMLSQLLHQPGQLQGIDLKRKHDDADLLHSSLQARVNINCIDYNATQVKLQEGITNETLQQFLDTPRPEWSRVRWINIDGMSWDVIQSCALHFDLHPLCVEDCIHIPQRIKADFYDHFLYVSLNLVSLEYMGLRKREAESDSDGDAVGSNSAPSKKGQQGREDRPLLQGMRPNGSSSSSFQPHPGKPPVRRLLSSSNLPGNIAAGISEKGRTAMTTTPRAVEVAAEQVSIFLLQDNTIISMFQTDGSSVTRPLWAQLREPRTLARDAEDASYLLNLLLDAIVDSAFPVVEAFADLIGAYESCVLERQPRPSNTRDLHVVTGDLATLRRTIQPTYNLVTALRAHAQASQEALGVMPGNPMSISPFSQAPGYAPATSDGLTDLAAPHVAAGGERGMLKDERDEHEAHGQTVHDNALFRSTGGHPHAPSSSTSQSASASSSPGHPNMPHHQHHHNQLPFRPMSPHAMQQKVLISRLTKTYLSDVQDHLSSTLDSINSLSEQCRDLIALIFNLAAHQTNQSMQALTVVSVLFLPLTFLAGIYGMNFDEIPELHWKYGYLYFYGMALMTVAVFVIVMARMGLLSTTG